MNIKLFNKIAAVGLDRLGAGYTASEDATDYAGVLVRSAALHEEKFPQSLLGIARAGAGVNNIPVDRCTDEGICVFNTPGANANGVKELAVLAMLLAARDVAGGIQWAKTLAGQEDVAKQVEKGKSAFAGTELLGKTLGIFGLGAIGALVANAALGLGMQVIGYDPWLSAGAALKLMPQVQVTGDLDELYARADYVSIHVPSTPDTRGMINAAALEKMKSGVKILNLARADLVNEADLLAALEAGKVSRYVTDFPTPGVIGKPGVIAIPHLGASTAEAEDTCAVMAVDQLKDFLENGNVKNSVNLPNVSLPRQGKCRLGVITKGESVALSAAVAQACASAAGTRKGVGYTLLETEQDPQAALAQDPAVIRVYRF